MHAFGLFLAFLIAVSSLSFSVMAAPGGTRNLGRCDADKYTKKAKGDLNCSSNRTPYGDCTGSNSAGWTCVGRMSEVPGGNCGGSKWITYSMLNMDSEFTIDDCNYKSGNGHWCCKNT